VMWRTLQRALYTLKRALYAHTMVRDVAAGGVNFCMHPTHTVHPIYTLCTYTCYAPCILHILDERRCDRRVCESMCVLYVHPIYTLYTYTHRTPSLCVCTYTLPIGVCMYIHTPHIHTHTVLPLYTLCTYTHYTPYIQLPLDER